MGPGLARRCRDDKACEPEPDSFVKPVHEVVMVYMLLFLSYDDMRVHKGTDVYQHRFFVLFVTSIG